jgi:uncharacterized protein YhfF
LVTAILEGRKMTTTSLVLEYEIERQPLPHEGQHSVVVDSNEEPVCVIETLEVRVVPLGQVNYEHVVDEGEGHATISEWRAGHESFWQSEEMTNSLGDSNLFLDDTTRVVLERFRVIKRFRSSAD